MSYSSYGNHYIKYGRVEKSYIDQGLQPIVNVPTPINPQDAVPKSYIDSLLSPAVTYPQIDFTLTATNRTEFITDLIGIKTILVYSVTDPDGPMAVFNVAKNNQNIIGQVNRQLSTSGITTSERLELFWDPSSGIECRKTNLAYDGVYRAIVLETVTPITLTAVNFMLSGTTPTVINGDLTGIKSVIINSQIANAPYAKIIAAKNNQNIEGNVSISLLVEGLGSGTKLESDWPINLGLRVNKTNGDYDGLYSATFIYS